MRIPKYLMTLSLLFAAKLSFAQHQPPMGTEELKQVISTTIKKNGQSIATYEKSYKILTEQARMEHTLARMTYDGSTQKFRLLTAEVVNQGRVQKVDFKEMTTAKMTDPKYGVQDLREVVVPLTRLQVGSTVNLSYQIIGEPVVSGVFDQVLGISNVVLAKDERYIFESLSPLSKVTVDFDDAYEMIESRKGSLYRIEVRPTAKAYAEVGKKQLVGSLFLTTGKSWPDLNKAVAPYYEKQLKQPLPPELLNIANEAKKKSTTKMQLEFIATEVSKIVAYSGQWNNKAGKYFPRSSIDVVKSGRGDCKDYSTTMTAILRKLDYQAYPALTTRMRSPEMLEQIPKIMQLPMAGIFNHAIVWMKDSAGVEWWVDPTNPMVIADVILDDILGSLGLILDGRSSVTLLPRENKIEAVMAVQQKISIDKANEISTVGSVELNPVSYNQMGMIERQLGP